MRLALAAVGRLRTGPEKALVDDYLLRAERTGRGLGIGPVSMAEVEDRRGGGPAAEGVLLRRAVPEGARLVVLDERGRLLGSLDFARQLADWRDGGAGVCGFVIGGADGVAPDLRAAADLVLSFGPMVWPHMLVRAMLAEQIYRAVSILAGTPYHRV